MPYRITDRDGNFIYNAFTVRVKDSGVLEAQDANAGVDIYFAPGSWGAATWVDSE